MCGITAAIQLDRADKQQRSKGSIVQELEASLNNINHRGPDARGHWLSEDGNVALGHARLSIKDLTANATQPLSNADSTIHAVVNGEFYRYDSLFAELAGQTRFKSSSDSELLIALYERDGIACLSALEGEFAFILYDSKRQLLFAARDRYGVKPLFWTISGDRLFIASTAHALLPFGVKPAWDVRSIVEDGWLHDERTLFRGVRKVMPGHYMLCRSFEYLQHGAYWQSKYPDKHTGDPRSKDEMIRGLRKHLYQAVEKRTQADVPIGVYLSGGLDSAVIAGILADIMRKKAAESPPDTPGGTKNPPFTCFSVGFDKDTEFDEMPIAQRTADHLGMPLVSQRVDEATLAENFEAAALHSEHHNPDLNSVAKFVLSGLVADAGYRVVLSGEGSDEHFAGYRTFYSDVVREPDLTTKGGNELTVEHRQDLTRRLEAATAGGYKGLATSSESALARRMLNGSLISSSLWAVTIAPYASWTTTAFGDISVQETRATCAGALSLDLIKKKWHPLHTAQYIWTRSILPNLILTCMGDRMEMAHSVEGRPPFLDHELTSYANGLPPSVKTKVNAETGDVTEKWILREAAKPYITQEMYERRKHPFTAPHTYQVGGPMHGLLSRLLAREKIEGLGFVDVETGVRLVDRAFVERDPVAVRMAFNVAQWVTLAEAWGIPKAEPPSQ